MDALTARPGSLVQPGAKDWGPGIVPPTGRKGKEVPLRKEAFFCYLETRGRVSGWTAAISKVCGHGGGEWAYGGTGDNDWGWGWGETVI